MTLDEFIDLIPTDNERDGNRFSNFSDDELYMLKRQAIESNYYIITDEKYSEKEIKIHGSLLNELIQAIKEREK